jgi:hypothetical protein
MYFFTIFLYIIQGYNFFVDSQISLIGVNWSIITHAASVTLEHCYSNVLQPLILKYDSFMYWKNNALSMRCWYEIQMYLECFIQVLYTIEYSSGISVFRLGNYRMFQPMTRETVLCLHWDVWIISIISAPKHSQQLYTI